MDWLVEVASVIGLTAEHVVAEPNAWGILQIESNRFDNCRVDCDVAVPLMLTCILGLLLKNGEPVSEGTVIIDDVGESQCNEVAHTKSKVDAYDEEHVVSVAPLLDEELRDADDVLHILDGLCGMLTCELLGNLFSSGGDETGLELTAALLDGGDIDDAAIRFCKI